MPPHDHEIDAGYEPSIAAGSAVEPELESFSSWKETLNSSLQIQSVQTLGMALSVPRTAATKHQIRCFVVRCVASRSVPHTHTHAIRDVKDIEYFESKKQSLTKAVGVWMDLISGNWEGSSVGLLVCHAFRIAAKPRRRPEDKMSSQPRNPSVILQKRTVSKKVDGAVKLLSCTSHSSLKWVAFDQRKRGNMNAMAFEIVTMRISSSLKRVSSPAVLGPFVPKQVVADLVDLLICIYGRARWSDEAYSEN